MTRSSWKIPRPPSLTLMPLSRVFLVPSTFSDVVIIFVGCINFYNGTVYVLIES